MSKINIDKFVEHLVKCGALDCNAVQSALFAQGLIFCNYKIQKIGENSPMQVEVERNQEGEDERIRKEILDYIDKSTGCKRWVDWIEKQGEQKVSVVDFKAKDRYVSKVDGKIHNIHQSIDNPEPKFKVGDWIVNNVCLPIQIASIEDGMYIFTEGDALSISFIDANYHLWTIKDAENGDALVTYDIRGNMEWLFLYRPNEHKLHIYEPRFYCHYDIKSDSFKKDAIYVSVAIGTKFRPATKEQRDLLFQKMKEAGYEWDAEKKELNKISQRMISAEAKENLYNKPSWSEEDEEFLRRAINATKDSYPITANWLKSLKERLKGE